LLCWGVCACMCVFFLDYGFFFLHLTRICRLGPYKFFIDFLLPWKRWLDYIADKYRSTEDLYWPNQYPHRKKHHRSHFLPTAFLTSTMYQLSVSNDHLVIDEWCSIASNRVGNDASRVGQPFSNTLSVFGSTYGKFCHISSAMCGDIGEIALVNLEARVDDRLTRSSPETIFGLHL